MAGFFKNLFGSDSPSTPRELSHPRDLCVGDFIKFKMYAPSILQDQSFKIEEINTYDYQNAKETEFVLRGSIPHTIFLTVEDTDEGADIRLSIKQKRKVIAQLFNLDEFAKIFDQEEGEVVLNRAVNPDIENEELKHLVGWTANKYYRDTYALRGYYHKGDFRDKSISEFSDDGEELDYYSLRSDDGQHAVEIEIYDGEEDVLVTFVTDESIFEELWPAD